jgi:Uma2 family endonuclease
LWYNKVMDATAVIQPTEQVREEQIPPLQTGDHLTRAEFERRYAAMPHVKKAELIEGIVYMPSPVSLGHSKIHADIMKWLGVYQIHTPGVLLVDNATVKLDFENEVQPDAALFIEPERGGQARVEGGYLAGTPELIVEVALSSVAYDLHEKLRVYRRNGVQEFMVLLVLEREIRWFQLVEGEYKSLIPGEDGVLHSQVFPGFHLHPDLFWADDLAGLRQILEAGVATEEHNAFVATLQGS